MKKTQLSRLKSYYDATAGEYDSFLQEKMSQEETTSFLSLIPTRHFHSVLDVACGTGRLSDRLARQSNYYIGIDVSRSMLKMLRGKTSASQIDLIESSATHLPFRCSCFGFATCLGLTGYLNRFGQIQLLSEISRVLHNQGLAAIDFLRPSSKPSLQIRDEELNDGNRVFLRSLNEIRADFEKARFRVIKVETASRQAQFLLSSQDGKD